MVGVEAAGCPALVLHPIPSCRAEAFRARRQRPCPDDIRASVTRGRLAQQMRAERMARPDVLVEGGRVLYLNPYPRRLPRDRAGGRRLSVPLACGRPGLQAIY